MALIILFRSLLIPEYLFMKQMAVAKAAMDSGVAKKMINIEDYQKVLEKRLETSLKRFR